ncbi:related to DNA polymerase eta [Cephalotrichum gorgonifer]|uniref:DNA polymerase eta n=1 Tax=Cephalotrichum gorgonifer TaxID=2041049 RepID=A0AAE8N1L1_9PEZI|nr:related to DNA polymerase eta [Cephalotrichum gorgonifer]
MSQDAYSSFTGRHLSQMASYAPTTPLRVVAHIDLDAFYAQCEMVRLGVGEDVPLAVQQWQGLIAVNYPARKFGIGRHVTITEALKLCPSLVAQHVATWREGFSTWAYRPDAAANIATDKVSLDPYRLQSRRILALVKDALPPPPLQRVEKASIDEVFLDLSAQVHQTLLARFPELERSGNDPSKRLPAPGVSALDWMSDFLVPLSEEDELGDPDWDDIALSIGAEIVRDIRAAVREKLGYTCSAGISHNKLLSKLGSAHKKPNQQTVIRRRAVSPFLLPLKFTKMRNLGGKLGDQVVSEFGTDEVGELLAVPLQQMTTRLGPETGTWLHNTVRGIDNSEVNPRTKIKSMLSAKSFRPAINSVEQAERWIRIFAADIYARLVEEGVLENRRRPKTVNLSLRHASVSRSRQTPIAPGRQLDQACLVELGNTLLGQILAEGEAWPCTNLSMAISGFEDGVTGNMGIGSFLIKGIEAQASRANPPQESPNEETSRSVPLMHGSGSSSNENSERKRRHPGDGGDIQRFFTRPASMATYRNPDEYPGEPSKGGTTPKNDRPEKDAGSGATASVTSSPTRGFPLSETDTGVESVDKWLSGASHLETARETGLGMKHRCPSHFGQTADEHESLPPSYTCGKCDLAFEDEESLQSHNDWHMALELQEREEGVERRVRSAFADRGDVGPTLKRGAKGGGRGNGGGKAPSGASASRVSSTLVSSSRQAGGRGGKRELEPGQRQLKFG